VVRPDEFLLTLSSGGQLAAPLAEPHVDPAGRLHTFCAAVPPGAGRAGWYRLGAILSAGASLRWLRDALFALPAEGAYERMASWAAEAPAGADGLLFLPYLAGERTPHMDPHARGMLIGLHHDHSRAEIVRAVMEGVALACYDAFSVMVEVGPRPVSLQMAGGGARSLLWRQIVADVFGLPVARLQLTDQSAAGALLLAGEGAGWWDASASGGVLARAAAPVEPDPGRHALYQERLSLFRAVYRRLGGHISRQ
jgi:xylulokinase